ncbi:cytochrome P450 [Pseudomonas sp. NFACC13-1]|uniref:cytochrome P450 n=1 Tax=Pseudomonas sp. NFACC13-1 TaxID=1566245 RepID=UPI0008921F1D|nr:cytochrome P450 [Pseudomonas sp. NFACC13-1]SDB35055.1 Cytochrome P450 [Pseudomonas sp. NFACC13-1]
MTTVTRPTHVPQDRLYDFDMFNVTGTQEPVDNLHEAYASRLHEQAPDVFYTLHNGGHWVITRYDPISEVVRDPEHFSASEQQIPRIENPPVFIPLSLDPPANLPYRQALMPHFSPKNVKALEEKIRFWANRLIDEVQENGSCEFTQSISSAFPVSIFMELMGMPLERLREFRELSDRFFSTNVQAELHALSGQIIGIMTELIEAKRQAPGDDLISYLLGVQIEDRPIRQDEIQNMCFLLFLGGMDTVANATAFTFRQLAQDPALQARLVADPALIPAFVDEGLRCFGIISTPRIVIKDCERFGVFFKQGDMVLNLLPISGRDDRRNPQPHTFDIDRTKRESLTFSTGAHLCLGHFLARAEMRILTEEWLKRIPAFKVAADHRPRYRMGLALALLDLPLQWN